MLVNLCLEMELRPLNSERERMGIPESNCQGGVTLPLAI